MRTVEDFHQDYEAIAGNKAILVPGANLQVADLHMHSQVDAFASPEAMLQAASNHGIDIVALTEHNLWTPGRREVIDDAKRLRDEHKLEIEVIGASEMAALPFDQDDNKAKHVLVFNQKHQLEPFSTWEELRHQADDQEALLYIAHPGLGKFSYGEQDISRMIDAGNVPDGLEVHNGSAALLDKFEGTVKWMHRSLLVPGWVKGLLPDSGSNAEAKALHTKFAREIAGFSGGSDAHEEERAGEVVTVFPEGRELFDAMRTRDTVVGLKRKLAPLSVGPTLHNIYHGLGLDDIPKQIQSRSGREESNQVERVR